MNYGIKALVTGGNGLLGSEVVKKLGSLRIETLPVGRKNFDITDKKATEQFVLNYKPDVIIHCAAYTAVDAAEEDEKNCFAINVTGTRHIAEACKLVDAKMVYISSDYVFNGEGETAQHVDKPPDPINVYGRSKAEGERVVRESLSKHFIVRTSWLYGENGDNFVKKMLKLAETQKEIRVVCDQVGAPTYAADLATLLADMIMTPHYGTYHGVNMGTCSWYEFTRFIYQKAGIDKKVIPVKSDAYPARAKRPYNSRLSVDTLSIKGFAQMPDWQDAIERYLNIIKDDGDVGTIGD